MFAMLAEAAVERGEGEIRGKEEAKAEGAGRGGRAGVDGSEDPKGRTRRVELSRARFLRLAVKHSRYESDVSRLRIPISFVA